MNTVADLLLQAVLAAVVILGFGMLFNISRHTLGQAILIGTVGHLLHYGLRTIGVGNELATFVGAFTVGILGYWNTRRRRIPRAVLTVTGIITMLPSIPAYEMIIYFFHGQTLAGLESVIRAVILAGAIAAGLSLARIVTAPDFRI